jgi:hypothetical protein
MPGFSGRLGAACRRAPALRACLQFKGDCGQVATMTLALEINGGKPIVLATSD